MSVVLETRALRKRFGGIVATSDVSLTLHKGARHALIGPNGAGKTTLINLLTGVLEPSSGHIALDGQDITRLAPHRRVRRGIVRTFQINQLFNALTPLQSLALAVSTQLGIGAQWWWPLGRDGRVAEACEALLDQFHLGDVMNQPVARLAYGKRRLLEIATALACRPRVLLLDEPVAGVPEGEREEIFNTVGALPDDVSVLLIEHDMDLVFNFARRVTVLVIGGTGYLYGGIFGAIAFKLLQDLISAWTPQYWTFWLGLFLVVLVLVGRDRLIRPWAWWRARA